MNCKKFLAVIISLVMTMLIIPSAVFADDSETSEVRYSTDGGETWSYDSLMNTLWSSGFNSRKDITIELLHDITLDSSWYSQQDLGYHNNVILDGKGHTIWRKSGTNMLFCIRYESNVTLKDITIDGGAVWSGEPENPVNTGLCLENRNAHLMYVAGNSTLTLDSGVVLKNSDMGDSWYGGAVVVGYSGENGSGKLIINDGVTICGNRANAGGAICVWGSEDELVINGGSITDNYATDAGGGIYVRGGNFKISGSPVIKDNYSKGEASNVYLARSNVITIDGELLNTDKIGVSALNLTVFTSGWGEYMDGKSEKDYFKSDVSSRFIALSGTELELKDAEAVVIDTAKATNVEVKLNDLALHDNINLSEDSTYRVVVSTANKEAAEAANKAIENAATGDTNKQIFDISVVKIDSNGVRTDISKEITNQPVTLTLPETPLGDVTIYHVNDMGIIDYETTVAPDGSKVEFVAPSFSTYAVTYTADSLEADDITKSIGVVFSRVDGTDNEYNVILKALDGKKINRFMSAYIAFKNECATVDYEIVPSVNMTSSVISENDASRTYRFNMDGANASGATGEAITIGTVAFTGYGDLKFSVDEALTSASINVVNTAEAADSIVDEYSVLNGFLKINEDSAPETGTITDTIEREKKNLTINIDFNNRVEKNAADYQNMKVIISGGDLAADEVIALGEDNFADSTSKTSYSFSKELTKNTAYTVTVSGSGYRTARYTVTMTGDKVLNFWNNAKDADTALEVGNDNSARKVTFLAGDIVKDNNINIYDLSAVVSYFGTKVDKDAHPEYAKYDLNRDGVIDSKDVAYVLVSWGK